MQNQAFNTVKLGIFVLTGLFLLILSLYILGKNRNLFGVGFELKTHFEEVNGLVTGNNVRIIDPLSTKPVVEEFTAREPKGVVIVNAAPNSKAGVAVTVMDQARAGNAAAVTLALQKD